MRWYPLLDLSGHVKKTDADSFAAGGAADVWKGEWTKKDSEGTVKVNDYSFHIRLLLF